MSIAIFIIVIIIILALLIFGPVYDVMEVTDEKNCPFCNKPKSEIKFSGLYTEAFFDQKPSNPGHMLVITRAHRHTIFDCKWYEVIALHYMVKRCKRYLDKTFQPGGYQIGINSYLVGGQSIPHCHIHVIPRYRGQTDRESMPRDKSWKYAHADNADEFISGARQMNPSTNGSEGSSVWKAWKISKHLMPKLNYHDEKFTHTYHKHAQNHHSK